MFYSNRLRFNLQLFAEGGGAASGTGAAGTTGASAGDAAPQTGAAGGKESLANVKYGKQTAETSSVDAGQINQSAADERAAQFKALIKGEYKDLYDAEVQRIISARFKATDDKVKNFDALSPTLELLYRKYGVEAGNVEALNKAIDEDDTYFEDEALEKGLSVEQVKEIRKMQRENEALKRQVSERETQERASKLYAAWLEQAEETKKVYPSFDFKAESANTQFTDLLRANVPVQTAYEIVHKDEIIASGMRFAAQETERKVANKIAASGRRPAESGLRSQSAAVVKSDVSQLTKADRQEIIRRVRNGEKITF